MDTIEKSSQAGFYKKVSIFIAMGILILGGLLVIAFILTGAQGSVVARAFITLMLLAAFSFLILHQTSFVDRSNIATIANMGALMLILIAGCWHVWAPVQLDGIGSNYEIDAWEFVRRTWLFIITAIVLMLTATAYSIYDKVASKNTMANGFRICLKFALALLTVAAVLASLDFTLPHLIADDTMFWRFITALFVACVILILIPVLGKNLNKPEHIEEISTHNTSNSTPDHSFNNAITTPHQATTKLAPPGWYEDSRNEEVELFWDGTQWTHARPRGIETQPAPIREP